MLLAGSATLTSANSAIKKQIEQEGFEFIQQIPAPTGMTGWVGHNNQHPGTVFIANDQVNITFWVIYTMPKETIFLLIS